MDQTDELTRLDRERRDADARYNEALTALDRIVVSTSGRERSPADVDRASTVLLEFLQQITAFVESKDRHLDAVARARIGQVAQALEPIAEIRMQVAVLQRAIETLTRTAGSRQSSAVGPQPPAGPEPSRLRSLAGPAGFGEAGQNAASAFGADDEYKYVAFEDAFRGSDAAIEARLRAYVPIFAAASTVLDIGCGRGELLSALRAAGVTARGIDTNAEMIAVARDRGLDAQQADALGYLGALPDASLGGIVSTQVVEHLAPSYLLRLIDTASRKLRPGAPIVLETINAACWLAFFSSYIRDLTHVRPIHPETLQYLLRASGFERVEIRYSAPVPDHMKMKTIDLPAGVAAATDASSQALAQLAHTINANAVILNNLLFSHLDYAAIGYRI